MRRFLVIIILGFLFIVEGVFFLLLPSDLLNSDYIFIPRFLMIGLFFFALYGSRNYAIILAFIFGLLFDVVYTEIIGIYLFMFPLLVYIVSSMMKVLQTNLVMAALVSIVGVALLELGVYEMIFLIHKTTMGFQKFLSFRLVPTLLLNLGFAILAAYPLKKHFLAYSEQLQNE